MRLRVVPDETSFDFFRRWKLWLGISGAAVVIAFVSFLMQGLNYGIDFQGGTTIRTESPRPVDVAEFRAALDPLALGDITISEVFDPTFDDDQNVAMIRIQAQTGEEAIDSATVAAVQEALRAIRPDITFGAVESVGPKVSAELIRTAALAVLLSMAAVLVYIWLRFEWQFAVGAVLALVHDVVLTIGIFSEFQIRFDLATIAALLTIVGYSLNDTVVIFDRVRENLIKYKKMPLKDVLNLAINETLSRTFMTSFTTLLALFALLALGGDVIRGFVFAITWGVVVGTYSTIFVATAALLWLGVKRDWDPAEDTGAGTRFGTDA